MNLVRIADVHGSWDRIEPRRGEFEFPKLARFYDAAASYGIQVLLSNGASCPPLWLKTEYPDVSILSSRGEHYPLGSSYHWACIHHPGYLQALEVYTRKLARFASVFPNHFGWQISNEIGFPFMPAREKGELGLYCYCGNCQEKFREWLQAKYATLERLTEAWSWSTTNFVYNSWEEAVGPESLPESWAGVTRWIDWRLFWQDAFAAFAGWLHGIIGEIDPQHPTSINTFNFKGFDRFGTFMGLDQWKIAQVVDHIGYDLYPGSGDKRKTRPEHSSIFLDHGRSVAQSAGRDFWIHEVESGPIGGWLLGPEYNTSPQDIENYIVESLGHAAKLLIYMPWREWLYQPLRWGALLSLQGQTTSRFEAASKIGHFISDQSDFLKNARVPRGEAAILESKPNAIFMRGVDQEELLFQAQRGAYRAFWDLGYSVDFISPAQLTDPDLSAYRMIYLPLLGLLDAQHARLLEEYVKSGGCLIGTARLGTLDEQGWYNADLPLPSLGRIFGLDRIEADTFRGQQIEYQEQLYSGAVNRDLVAITPGTEIMGWFTDGHPAVTRATLGMGSGVYISTQADIAFLDTPGSTLLPDLIHNITDAQPRLLATGDFLRSRGVDPHLLESNRKSLILCSNYLSEGKEVLLDLDLGSKLPAEVKQIYPEFSSLDYQVKNGRLLCSLSFKEKEVMILELIWK